MLKCDYTRRHNEVIRYLHLYVESPYDFGTFKYRLIKLYFIGKNTSSVVIGDMIFPKNE